MFPSSPTRSSVSCPPASEPSVTCHVSKFTNRLLPLRPRLSVSPRLQHATFLSSPTCSSLFLPSSESSFAMCHVSELTNPLLPLPPLWQVSPLFAMCHISELTNPFLPLPPLQEVSPHLQCAMFLSSPTHFSHFLPSSKWVGSSVIHMGNHNVPNALLFISMWLHPPTHPSTLTEIFCLLANWNPLHYTHATRCK